MIKAVFTYKNSGIQSVYDFPHTIRDVKNGRGHKPYKCVVAGSYLLEDIEELRAWMYNQIWAVLDPKDRDFIVEIKGLPEGIEFN